MTHSIVTIALLSAAALLACNPAMGQSPPPLATKPAAPRASAPVVPPALDLGDCPDTASSFEVGKNYSCSCPASAVDGSPAGPVYGSLVYANDSNICSAAVHAGVLKTATAGAILLKMQESPPVFKSATRNGMKSEVWASAAASAFQFALPANP
jgi:LCCL domain